MRFAYLLYVSRSGSTMLASQIARHMPDVLVFPELDLVGRLFAHGDRFVRNASVRQLHRIVIADKKTAALDLAEDDWQAILGSAAGRGILALLVLLSERFAQRLGRPSPRVVLFQRGTLLSVAAEIAELDPRARFIHIYRDPRAVVSSIVSVRKGRFDQYQARYMGRADAIGLSRHWATYTRRVDDLRERFQGRVLAVKYETLCQGYAHCLDSVARFIGVRSGETSRQAVALPVADAERELHRHVGKAPMTARIDAWRAELAPWRGYLVEATLGDALQRNGYEAHFRHDASLRQRWAYLARGGMEYVFESIQPAIRRMRQVLASPGANLRLFKRRLRRASGQL